MCCLAGVSFDLCFHVSANDQMFIGPLRTDSGGDELLFDASAKALLPAPFVVSRRVGFSLCVKWPETLFECFRLADRDKDAFRRLPSVIIVFVLHCFHVCFVECCE